MGQYAQQLNFDFQKTNFSVSTVIHLNPRLELLLIPQRRLDKAMQSGHLSVYYNTEYYNTEISPELSLSPEIDWLWTLLFSPGGTCKAPKVYRKCDRSGKVHYELYDPATGLHNTFASEREMRNWLNQRFFE